MIKKKKKILQRILEQIMYTLNHLKLKTFISYYNKHMKNRGNT